jgi:hypothetical protein
MDYVISGVLVMLAWFAIWLVRDSLRRRRARRIYEARRAGRHDVFGWRDLA